jgi:hypothetical protein
MLFKKKHIEMVLAGRKTQTRRLPGKSASYSVRRVYAIRDRWFSKAHGYILITRKFTQKLGEISLEDIRKEGYNNLEEFRKAWEEIHGPKSWQPNLTVTVYEFKPLHKRRASTNLIFARRYTDTRSSSSGSG